MEKWSRLEETPGIVSIRRSKKFRGGEATRRFENPTKLWKFWKLTVAIASIVNVQCRI